MPSADLIGMHPNTDGILHGIKPISTLSVTQSLIPWTVQPDGGTKELSVSGPVRQPGALHERDIWMRGEEDEQTLLYVGSLLVYPLAASTKEDFRFHVRGVKKICSFAHKQVT